MSRIQWIPHHTPHNILLRFLKYVAGMVQFSVLYHLALIVQRYFVPTQIQLLFEKTTNIMLTHLNKHRNRMMLKDSSIICPCNGNSPDFDITIVWYPPHAINAIGTAAKAKILFGFISVTVWDPIPSCPSVLLPHAYNSPSLVRAIECSIPHAICTITLVPNAFTIRGVRSVQSMLFNPMEQ